MFEVRRMAAVLFLAMAFMATGRAAEAGYAHFLYDTKTGKILSAENADEINHPASLTKMMTLYLTFEALRDRRLSWDRDIVITPNAASKIPSKLGVPAGMTITVREAVMGMVIRSANDAAAAMGDYLGGSEDQFAVAMTRKARQLGMSRTVFRNASGLPDSEQVTTARDMATLSMALVRDFPREYALFSEKNMQFRGKRLRGHNNLMYRYPDMDGIKTGYTKASGYNIASAVNINGRRVIGVVLGGKTARIRDDRMAELLDRHVPGNNVPAGGALVALEQQKRHGEGTLPLAFASPKAAPVALPTAPPAPLSRKEISLGTAAPTRTARLGNLDTTPQEPVGPIVRIQIAAAGSLDQASDMLGKALPVLSKDFGSVTPSVESYTEAGRELFRARFVGFADAGSAARACSVLQAKAIECFVVR